MQATIPPLRLQPVSPPALLLQAINSHRLLFVAVLLAVSTVLSGFVLTLTPRFTATASVSVNMPEPDPLQPPNMAAQVQQADDALSTSGARLLTSRDVVRPIVEQLNYAAGREPGWGLAAICYPFGEIGPCRGVHVKPSLETRVSIFLSRLYVATHPRTRILDIQFEAEEPELAANAVNMLVAAVQQREIADQTKGLTTVSEWLVGQTNALRARWSEAESRLGNYRAQNSLTASSQNGSKGLLITQQIGEAATALSAAQADLGATQAQAEAAQGAAKAGDPRSVVKAIDNPTVSTATDRVAELSAQRAALLEKYGPRYPSVIGIEAQLKAAQGQVGREVGVALSGIKARLASKQNEVNRLTDVLAKLRAAGDRLTPKEVELSSLEHEAAAARQVYEEFNTRARQRADRTELLLPSMQFVSRASIPETKSFPSRTRFFGSAFGLGLMAASVAAYVREFTGRGFNSGRQITELLGTELLASIPRVSGGSHNIRGSHVLEYPWSEASQAIRALGTLMSLNGTDSLGRSAVITSAVKGEGKTMIAAWLARVAAQSGQRVLLIDADKPGGSNNRGLAELLSGTANASETLFQGVEPGIDAMSAGRNVSRMLSPRELQRLKAFVQGMKAQYDLIIFDTPPTSIIDARTFAKVVDHTIVVLHWDKTTKKAVTRCIEQLRASGANVLGVVFSMVQTDRVLQVGHEVSHAEAKQLRLYHSNAARPDGVSGMIG